jgi:hypothetical protein
MPTDSNESSISSSTTTLVVPSMSTSTTSITNYSQPNSPLQSSSTKQSNKLKHFLSSLYHFGSDISNEIGERVRALILALIVSFVLFFDTGFPIA